MTASREGPTVVVLGFFGSQRRHVDKYADAWRKHVPGVKRVVGQECLGLLSMFTLGKYLTADRVMEAIRGEKELVFHVVSNGGAFVYTEIVRRLPKDVKVLGTIFDCCPGSLSPWLFFKATAANEKNKVLKVLHEMVPYAILALLAYRSIRRTLVTNILLEVVQRILTRLYNNHIAMQDPAACPALFLYTTKDALIPYEIVEYVAEKREKTFGNVWKKKWDVSGHVRLLYDVEDEYTDELRKFAQNIGIA